MKMLAVKREEANARVKKKRALRKEIKPGLDQFLDQAAFTKRKYFTCNGALYEIRYDGFLGIHTYDMHNHIPKGFMMMQKWSTGFRAIYICKLLQTIITYCEGDLTVIKYQTARQFKEACIKAHKFYQEY